jgi:hypothetical protein
MVEDEPRICDLMRMILHASYDVKTAFSVEQAEFEIPGGFPQL